MFNRLTVEIFKLPKHEKLDLIRKLYEGVLDFDTVIKSHGRLGNLKQHFDSIFSMIESLSNNMTERSTNDKKAELLLNNYCNQPISSRVTDKQIQDLKDQIYKIAGTNSPVLVDLEKIREQDTSLIQAVNTFVELFILAIYSVPNVPSMDIKKIVTTLKDNPIAVIASNNIILKSVLIEFQLYQDTLSHCYCSSQRRNDIQFLTNRFFELQLNYYVPFIKTIAFFFSINDKFDKQGFNKDKFKLMDTKPPECVGRIKIILKQLPNTLSVLDPQIDTHIKTIRDVFEEIYHLASKEAPKQILRSKELDIFWRDFFNEMQGINAEENIFEPQNTKLKAAAK